MSESGLSSGGSNPLHVLIAGAGVVGLTLAQGCKQRGIPFTIFERTSDHNARQQGWALTLHWCLRSLRRTIGPELSKEVPGASVDPTLKLDDGNFLFLNAETGEVRYKIPPTKERFRLNRLKLLNILSTGVNVEWGKDIEYYEEAPDGTIRVHFKDGTSASGSMLIGADGNNSNVRKCLIRDNQKSSLTKLPVNVIGVVRHFTPEEGVEPHALDPLLFHGLHPKTSNYIWYSVQEVYEEGGQKSWDALVLVSWPVKDKEKDAIPPTNRLMVANIKERARQFSPPLRRLVDGIPNDTERVTPLSLADFSELDWSSHENVALVGDAAHAMTMYRGEAANHGILDAALLIDQLVRVKDGEVGQKEAIAEYEKEMKERCRPAVMKSRRAALDAHCWEDINDDSPLIGGRWPPATA
ncbi:hypothetical protein B7463_g9768, partial [Scytalidium lignicola]